MTYSLNEGIFHNNLYDFKGLYMYIGMSIKFHTSIWTQIQIGNKLFFL